MIIKSIRQLIEGRPMYATNADTLLDAACAEMAQHGIGALLVLDTDGALSGILSERDVVVRAVAAGLDPKTTPVSQVMTADPVTVNADDALSDALAARIGGAFRHLPVLDAGRPVGILSFRDIPTDYRMMFERFAEMSH